MDKRVHVYTDHFWRFMEGFEIIENIINVVDKEQIDRLTKRLRYGNMKKIDQEIIYHLFIGS